jgi:hypothetical protein
VGPTTVCARYGRRAVPRPREGICHPISFHGTECNKVWAHSPNQGGPGRRRGASSGVVGGVT